MRLRDMIELWLEEMGGRANLDSLKTNRIASAPGENRMRAKNSYSIWPFLKTNLIGLTWSAMSWKNSCLPAQFICRRPDVQSTAETRKNQENFAVLVTV